ncbi:5-hydroxytryptamine receptor 7-like [Amblyraja radiata]|uniref:5-hydroxytryptamine receptor 7-like n=1 Tax=Amblyraja radiata TaxID=386614 RepID=UPI001403A768|nr:5-hydroxytryptamine receptor 7-like [Amblyraja radiata]
MPKRHRHSPSSGPALSIASINIEGFSRCKADILATAAKRFDIVCMQETHTGPTQHRPAIPGMKLVAEIRHRQYGSAVFSRPNLAIEEVCTHTTEGQMGTITVALPNISVTSVYKPPQSPFLHSELPDRCKRKYHISIGDFNAHSSLWGYEVNNQDGDEVETWLESKHLTLIHDSKLPKSFHSARWKRGYNPDLVCVSSELSSRAVKEVLDPIPHTQHRPITITIRSALQATTVPFRRRFNLRKADWLSFQQEIEDSIPSIPSHPNNYTMFIELLKRSARRHIPRGCQTEYIPGLSETSSDLLKAYHRVDTALNVTCRGSSTNCSRSQLLLPSFSTASAIRVLLTLAMAGISSSLNVYVLLGALRARRSHIRTLLVNLCGADLLVTALVMPMDACWNYTVQWAAGAAACRLLMFLKLFAMYSCALVTLVISLDRYCAVVRPLSIGLAARRNRAMLAAAWMSSGALAAPQLVLFRTVSISVPAPFTQCVTHGSFPQPWHETLYFLFTFLWLFLLPLIIMVFCYASIFITITRKTILNGKLFLKDADWRCSKNYVPKVRVKTLKLSIVLVSTFIICWTPYYILGFWYNFFPAMINKKELPESINHALFTFGMLNSFIDPVVCRIGYFRPSRS